MKIYLMQQESMVGGEKLFNAVPCKDLKTAQEVMRKEKETLLNEGHFADYELNKDRYCIDENTEEMFHIWDEADDGYYEYLEIVEKEIL